MGRYKAVPFIFITMASRYVNITEDEIKGFLSKWKQVTTAPGRELQFEVRIGTRTGINIQCMTSVADGSAREVGQDSIKVFAMDERFGHGYIKTIRVYRTTNWKSNLIKAYKNIYEKTINRMVNDGRLARKRTLVEA